MNEKAIKELLCIVVLYSLSFLLPSWLIVSPELAQCATSVVLPILVIALYIYIRYEGMLGYLGLSCSLSSVPQMIKQMTPYCVVLIIPLLNIYFAWGTVLGTSLSFTIILICSAVIEELCFRGYLLSMLLNRGQRQITAVCIAAVVFAALHLFNIATLGLTYVIAQFIVAGCVGVVFGLSRLTTKSIYPSIMAHVLINITSNQALLYDDIDVWILCLAAVFSSVWSYLFWRKRSKAGKE